MNSNIPPSFEEHTSALHRSNDGRLHINVATNPKGFTVSDTEDSHVECFTSKRTTADAFVAGYDYRERLDRAGVSVEQVDMAHRANVARIQAIIVASASDSNVIDGPKDAAWREGLRFGLNRALDVLEGRG